MLRPNRLTDGTDAAILQRALPLHRQFGTQHHGNVFELAVAAAISLFGLQSDAALATVVGVLIEVPVTLSVVRIVLATRRWHEATG